MKSIYKQGLILFVFSILISIGAIIHGFFFDLDFSQIKRLTLKGLLLTFTVVFPGILFLEWIFDFNNRERMAKLENKLDSIRRKK